MPDFSNNVYWSETWITANQKYDTAQAACRPLHAKKVNLNFTLLHFTAMLHRNKGCISLYILLKEIFNTTMPKKREEKT